MRLLAVEVAGAATNGSAAAAPVTGWPKVKRGDEITLTWTFEARGKVAPSWRIFAHIEGPSGPFINGDHRPVRPFEWWRAGQFIRYTTTVIVPRTAPAGRYVVWTGMFAGKRRAEARAPHAKIVDDAVAATELEVSP
ncbi:MAG: hypothetical protein H7138_17015 [Myxococcales bacterium]|nr:hypothetical protein [Myxococcales bacterium]